MMDSFEDSYSINIDSKDSNKQYEDIFFLESNHNTELNISINEDSFIPFNLSESLSKTKPTTASINNSNVDSISRSNSNYSAIELKRKKNREASKISRQKKKEDIICLVKTNEILKEKIKSLTKQIKNHICSQCKMKIQHQSITKSVHKEMKNDDEPIKQHYIDSTISSSSSLNPSQNRARTAMFISMVVIFCVIVNSFSNRSKNYLRKATMNNYYNYNDYFNMMEMNTKESNDISQCFDLLRHHYSINLGNSNNKNDNNNEIIKYIEIVHDKSNKASKCQKLVVNKKDIYIVDANSDNENQKTSENSNDYFKLKIIANKNYLINQLFENDNINQQEPISHLYLQLDCVDIFVND